MFSRLKEKNTARILIVDDDFTLRAQLKFFLSKLGYTIAGEADGGATSVAMARDLDPDIVIMDVMMDTPDAGIHAAREINELLGIPIIFLTGQSGTNAIENAMGAKPYGYLVKPLKPEALEATLKLSLLRYEYEKQLEDYQKALSESEALFRGIFGAMNNGYYRTDMKGVISLVNPALVTMLGYTSESDLVGRTLEDLKLVEKKERSHFNQILHTDNKVSLYETIWSTRSGSSLHVIEDARVVEEVGNKPYIEGSIQDISKLKTLENSLRHNQKMEVIAILGDRIAHEINNRLTSILGYSDLSIMKTKGDEKLQKYLSSIKANANDATEVIRHLLHFSRKSDSNRSMVDTVDFLSNLEPIIRTLIWKNIKLVTDFKESSLYVETNSDAFEQALMNIIINAREAMLDGGELSIRNDKLIIGGIEGSKLGISPGAYSRITVKDTGSGMSPDIVNNIFDPFFTTKNESLSTGLGLSVVKDYVDSNNGAVLVSSELEKGSEFIILIPLKHQDHASGR